RCVSLSTRKLSSLSLRRRPTSVLPNASIITPPSASPFRAGAYGVWLLGSTRAAHGFGHLAHGALHAHEHGAGHDGVADVQLADLGQRRHAPHVLVVEAVAGVHQESQLAAQLGRVLDLA